MIVVARRKTIYEYHRVNFSGNDITNDTIIMLKALPTCLQFKDCASCLDSNIATFNVIMKFLTLAFKTNANFDI